MNPATADPTAQPPDAGWPQSKFIFFIVFVLAAQIAFLFLFGAKKPSPTRAVTNVPQLQFADAANELIALDDPTLFALPHANDYATGFWQRPPAVAEQNFRWSETPRYLSVTVSMLGLDFTRFMQTNPPVPFALDFRPPPPANDFAPAILSPLPQSSTFQIAGDLTQRPLLTPIQVPSLPYNDVLPPGRVQALVDAAGNVLSVVLLEPSGLELADTNALAIARSARFAPAAKPTFGQMVFNWHTIPAAP
jgi:TonB family protein